MYLEPRDTIMNKKPGLLFTVCILALIILATVFGKNFGGSDPVVLPHGVSPDNVLYVCPVASNTWDSFAKAMTFGRKFITMGFVFAFIVLLFSWSWALYQNLVKDKFSADAYKNPWELTKLFFWAGVICAVLVMTPNYFRTVHVHKGNQTSNWVLCENTSPNARPVNPKAVTLH